MAAEGVNIAEFFPKLKATIKTRFSSLRFKKVVDQFNPIQRGYIINNNLENLLNMPSHLMIPMHLLQWLVFHTSSTEASTEELYFKKKDKIIYCNKDTVDKVFGLPMGTTPFVLESSDPEVVMEVEELRKQYLIGKTIPVRNVESIMLGANSEVVFMRSFVLFFITTVLCPSTRNFVNQKYMYSLRDRDIPHFQNLDFGNLCLQVLWDEMEAWKNKIKNKILI